jgi:hypothetical protein
MLPWTFVSGLRTTRSYCCAKGPCSFVQEPRATWTTRVVDSGCPRSSATAFAASSRAGHTCRHEMARLRDVRPGDVETTMDAINNLHQRKWLHAYTNNITTLADVGTTVDVISNGSYGLHQRCRRIKETSTDAIHNSSTSTSTTLSQRKDESGCYYGHLRIYTNDTRHSALTRRTKHAM